MRRLSLGFVMLLALSPALSAQVSSVSIQQNLTSATCPGSGCVALAVSGYGGIAVQITGTYSGTVSFEGSVDGVTFTALNLTPTNSTTAATSTTSTGVWSGGMGGLTTVRARMSSYTSGTASVSLKTAPTAARGGGSGSGITFPGDTKILFDNNGAVGGSANLTWNGTSLFIGPYYGLSSPGPFDFELTATGDVSSLDIIATSDGYAESDLEARFVAKAGDKTPGGAATTPGQVVTLTDLITEYDDTTDPTSLFAGFYLSELSTIAWATGANGAVGLVLQSAFVVAPTALNATLYVSPTQVSMLPLKTTGAATGKKVVCVDTSTGILYTSSTGVDCSN